MLSIGKVAKKTGLKVPTIRFYEQEGLVRTPPRTQSGRRLYADADVRRLSFVRHARTLGFELTDIRSLLDLADHPHRPCGDADRIASKNLETVRQRIEQLRALEQELSRMIVACAGGPASECRIIESLSDHGLCTRNHD
ncbi:MerR family transcriptional regulator [Vitreimonas flagellata]|jgi:DNA-binding transcriptional MerR regulator|uniref:MerR family transcriptional regulator n=1 Tax=Vitreimonas flagellata TaxID=2560861 RepID=UPI00107541B8|nr:helix-turn-helix domain-containing protein [Vitreimonas flagellata]